MADETTTTDPADTGEATNNPAQDPQQGTGKTYTEAELNAIVTSRLSKAERSVEKRIADAVKKAEERAKLGDAERLAAERDELAKKLETLEAEKTEALLRASLAKDVADVDYALFKVRQAGEKYLDRDGNLNIAALLKDHPTLKAQPDPKAGPAPTTAGGGAAKGLDMNAAIRRAAGRA